MSKFLESVKAKKAAAAKAAAGTTATKTTTTQAAPGRKGLAFIAKMTKGNGGDRAPWGTSGPVGRDSAPYSILKVAAYAAGVSTGEECKDELALSERIKSVYGIYYPFENRPRSVLVPSSANYLPTRVHGGEIQGAAAIKKELGERLKAGMDDFDPEEAAFYAKKAGYASKALGTLSEIAGGSMVAPPMLGDLIDLQRNMEALSNAGAQNVELPPNGRIQFPKLSGGSTAYWVGETQSITESQQTTGQLSLEAKKLAVRVPLTNELLRYASPNVEAMVRMDMALQGALKADLAQLEGTGGTQIKGIINYPTQTAWAQGTDKVIAYTSVNTPGDGNTGYLFQPDDVYGMEASLPDTVSLTAWIGRRQFWGKVMNRRADAVSASDGKGLFMFEAFRDQAFAPQPSLAGGKLVRSSQVSNTRVRGSATNLTYTVAGDFREWVVARLGVLEFMADPYTQLQNYQTVLQAVQLIDAGPRHLASFVLCDQLQVA